MKRKGEGSCLLKRGKPRLELPRWSISISEWSCSCTATTTLQGGTSEERDPLNALANWGNSYFSTRLKIRRQLDAWEANKNKRGRGKGRGGRKKKKFEILRRTEFYKLFEAGYSIIHLMLQAAVRQYGNTLMHDNSFHRPCVVKRKCVRQQECSTL